MNKDYMHHKNVHKALHHALLELVSDFQMQTDKVLSKTSVKELIKWSQQQTVHPSRESE